MRLVYCINKLLFILIAHLVPCLDTSHTSSFYIAECKDSSKLYTLGGRIMAVRYFKNYDGKSALNLEACISSHPVEPTEFDTYEMLWNVTVLELRGVVWPSLSNLTYDLLEEVTLWDVTPIGDWGPCSNLKEMRIHDSINLTMTSPDWLTNCTGLDSLTLLDLTVEEIRSVVDSTINLQSLKLWRIKDKGKSLIAQKQLFSTARGRQQWIRNLEIFEDIVRLNKDTDNSFSENKDYSTWEEVSEGLLLQLLLLPSLKDVSISDSHFDLCALYNTSSMTFSTLESLSLYQTNTTHLCLKNQRILPKLKTLSVLSPSYIEVQFSELLSTPGQKLDANFYGMKLGSFSFVRNDYLALSGDLSEGSLKGNVVLNNLVVRIQCDCKKTMWFARALREGLVKAPGVSCSDGSSPKDIPCEEISCERVSCVDPCVCCARRGGVVVDCRGASLRALPPALLRRTAITALLAPDNHLHTLPEHLPDDLQLLDLSGNNIWQDGAGAVSALFAQPARRVRLAGNNIFCSCDNKLLITTLQDHREQIEDYSNLTCTANNQNLDEVNVTELCAAFERDAASLKQIHNTSIGVTGVVITAATILLFGVILYYRRRDLKIFLFSKGWCLSCIQEEELDSNRRYDVFLSFCHADTEIVLDKILPVLDGQYSVCVHLRDWCPGEMIPTHIALSVAQSRRTVVVISRNFVRSLWGRLEFQTARMSAIMEGRVRVVVIVLDDVLERDEIGGDIKAYIRLNTYLKWGDPWFWEKLRYALPHNPSTQRLFKPSSSVHRINEALEQYISERRQLQAHGNIVTPSNSIVVTPSQAMECS